MKVKTGLSIQQGDWVTGTSLEDERIIGFVENVFSDVRPYALVYVTESDRPEAVGTTVQAALSKVGYLPEQGPVTAEDYMSLIDVALSVHDEAWFQELTAGLKAVKPSDSKSFAAGSTAPRSRVRID